MKNKKTIIDVQGVISKENGKEFTEQEYEQIVDAFIELVEGKNCMFGVGFGHMTEKEYIDSIDIDYKKGFDLAMKYIEESPCDPDIIMLITKEHQEAMVNNYAKEGHSRDEILGFIDGVGKMMEYIIKLNLKP